MSAGRSPADAGGSGLDAVLALFAAVAWGFAAFAFGARFVSPAAGGLLGLAVLTSASAMTLGMHLRDRVRSTLIAGRCPRCRGPVVMEHRHRHWDPTGRGWQPPATTWDCRGCDFAHSEEWGCPACFESP